MKYLGELIGKTDENGNVSLPPEVTLKVLIEYSTLSKAAFIDNEFAYWSKKF